MRCWSYQSIVIHNVTWGRMDEETCPDENGKTHLMEKKTCQNPHVSWTDTMKSIIIEYAFYFIVFIDMYTDT